MRWHSPTTWYCETLSPRFVEKFMTRSIRQNPASGQRGFCFYVGHDPVEYAKRAKQSTTRYAGAHCLLYKNVSFLVQ